MTAILGGGISGLSAAYYALENPKIGPLVIYEASSRIGGWIRSIKLSDGTIFEKGPRTIRQHGPAGKNTLRLIEQLGLTDNIIPIRMSDPAAKNRLIFAHNKLHLLPNSLSGMFKKNTLLNRSLISLMWNDLKAPKMIKDDESTYSFIERRLGQDTADNLINPMLCGICAGDGQKISVNFLFKSLFEAEQKHGSIVKGLLAGTFSKSKNASKMSTEKPSRLEEMAKKNVWALWGMKGGLETLPLTLANNVHKNGVEINTEHKCEKLRFNGNHVELTVNGKVEKYSRVISSLQAKHLGNLVEEQHPELSKELKEIPSVTVAVVNLQFPENVLSQNAFGFLVRPKEEIPILGVIFDSCIFHQNSTVLTVMMGGAWFEKYFGKCSTDEHLVTVAVNQVRDILNIKEDPVSFDVSVLKDCIPQYVVGHTKRVKRIRDYISTHRIPLALCGSSYEGVGVNDVILSAKEAASDISSYL